MLYDAKRWDKPTVKPDPWSLSAFVAWAETKPANAKFDYCYPDSCVIAQWRQHLGLEEILVLLSHIPGDFKDLVDPPGSGGKSTFGALVKRYRRRHANQ